MLRSILFFVYEYYGISLLLFSIMASAIIGSILILKIKEMKATEFAVIIPILLILCCLSSYFVYRYPLLYDEVIVMDVSKTDNLEVSEITSSGRCYSEPSLIQEGEDNQHTYILKVPYGVDRKIILSTNSHNGTYTIIYSDVEETVDLNSVTDDSYELLIPSSSTQDIFGDVILKTITLFILGWIWNFVIRVVINIKVQFIYEQIKKNCIGILTFLFLLVQFLTSKANEIAQWVSCWYATDYSMGISSRFMLGSILSLFYKDYLDVEIAKRFCNISLIILIFIVSILVNAIYKKADDDSRDAILFLCCCYICSPGSISSMWTIENFGRLEAYTLILTLFGVYLFCKIKNVMEKYILLSIISVFSIAIYQGFIFLYFPIFLIVMICELYRYGFKLGRLILTIANVIVTCLSFVWALLLPT